MLGQPALLTAVVSLLLSCLFAQARWPLTSLPLAGLMAGFAPRR